MGRAKVLLRGIVAALFTSGASDAVADPAELFEALSTAHPKAAIGLAWSVDGGAPEVRVAGPTHAGGAPVDPTARWHIGSITKSMTAALAVGLAEEGVVDLDAPISTYLDTLHRDWGAMTLRGLLSHTAGANEGFADPVLAGEVTGDGPTDRRDRLAPSVSVPPEGEAGAFAYSNVGYVLAGHVLEIVTGSPWEDLVQERIAGPAGLTSFGFGAPDGLGDPRGRRRWLGLLREIDPARDDADNPPWMGPAGTVHLTLADLHRWAEALRRACGGEPGPVSAGTCAEMTTEVSEDYGLGLVIQTMGDGRRFIWHNGSNTAWYAIAGFSPEAGVTVAVTLNRPDGALADQLLRDVVADLLARP